MLAQETASFDLDTFDVGTLHLDNPPRRDVAMLTSGGYMVIAFPTDNPGIGLMHCHIVSPLSTLQDLYFESFFDSTR